MKKLLHSPSLKKSALLLDTDERIEPNVREIRERIKGDSCGEMRIERENGVGRDQERVAVCCALGCKLCANVAAGARPIFDDDRLPE